MVPLSPVLPPIAVRPFVFLLDRRPTPLVHGIAEWVTTFRRGWLDGAGVPEAERAEIAAAVADRFGSDTADYVRLRFIMRKPS